jgi:hypothetical protein
MNFHLLASIRRNFLISLHAASRIQPRICLHCESFIFADVNDDAKVFFDCELHVEISDGVVFSLQT